MKKYIPLHVHTHYSLLDGLSKPIDIANRCEKIGVPSCAITDHGNISGCIQFYSTMKSRGIKPILGTELYLCDQSPEVKDNSNKKLSHIVLLAKNLQGWKDLINIVSASNKPEHYYYKPRLDLNSLYELVNGNIICLCGHPGSYLANQIYSEGKFVDDKTIESKIKELQDVFGQDNTFVLRKL